MNRRNVKLCGAECRSEGSTGAANRFVRAKGRTPEHPSLRSGASLVYRTRLSGTSVSAGSRQMYAQTDTADDRRIAQASITNLVDLVDHLVDLVPVWFASTKSKSPDAVGVSPRFGRFGRYSQKGYVYARACRRELASGRVHTHTPSEQIDQIDQIPICPGAVLRLPFGRRQPNATKWRPNSTKPAAERLVNRGVEQ